MTVADVLNPAAARGAAAPLLEAGSDPLFLAIALLILHYVADHEVDAALP